jgi:hypothetical protein
MKENCNIIIYILCGAFLFCPPADAGDAQDRRADAPAVDPVIEMEPYVVKGERILPNPESWVYINIPAVEIKRNNRVDYMPGYEILSSRSRQNSLALAGELQLRQVANALVFPDFVRALPRSTIIVVLDDGRLRDNVRANIWEGDSLYTATALRQSSGRADPRYSIGTQINTHFYSDFVTEIPSGYDGHANREMPDADNERAVRNSRAVANLVGIAANGGPLRVRKKITGRFYLD